MDDNLGRFRKYIIKKIVDTIDYDSEADEFIINRVHISDDIIREIESEGARYGLTNHESLQVVNTVSDGIILNPSIVVHDSITDISKVFIPGDHITVSYCHEVYGDSSLELLFLGGFSFVVLSSTLTGIQFADKMIALSSAWAARYSIDFSLYRDRKKIPFEDAIIRIGKITQVSVHKPSCAHEIIDSDCAFEYEEENTIEEQKKPSHNNVLYCWDYISSNSIYFDANTMTSDNEATFEICFKEGEDIAKLRINKASFKGKDDGVKKQVLESILRICKLKGDIKAKGHETDDIRYVKTFKAGKIKKVLQSYGDAWVMIEQPVISIVYYENN